MRKMLEFGAADDVESPSNTGFKGSWDSRLPMPRLKTFLQVHLIAWYFDITSLLGAVMCLAPRETSLGRLKLCIAKFFGADLIYRSIEKLISTCMQNQVDFYCGKAEGENDTDFVRWRERISWSYTKLAKLFGQYRVRKQDLIAEG